MVVLAITTLVIINHNQKDQTLKNDFGYDEVIDPYGYPKTDKPMEMYEAYKAMTYRAGNPTYSPGYKMEALKQAVLNKGLSNARVANYDFIERGPSNVPGRTRGLIVDPSDSSNQTWLAGTVGGGVWKTTNAGSTWENKTPEFPNLSTTSLAYSRSNPDIIYAGTGEGWLGSAGFIGGSGIFKSEDRGETWVHLESTNNENFDIINRIIVDPQDPNTILACTNNDPLFGTEFFSYILKSVDGGETWNVVYDGNNFVQHIIADPNDFNTLYAAVRNVGVIKSTDAGESWIDKSNGLTPSGRIELAISPVNSARLFASVEGNITFQREDGGNGSDIYYSDDAAENWYVLQESSNKDVDYFNTQGWYDNTIMAHPFDEDVVYVGGVGTFKVTLEEGTEVTDPTFAGAIEENTPFLSLVNFAAGEYYGNKIAIGSASSEEFTSIEIRFGPGISQMAHRFLVPEGRGAGVGDAEYEYQDYVEVPFQVWDIDVDPPRQLMVSFRDQQRDGTFNLIHNNTEGETQDPNHLHSREYLYINAQTYSETPSAEISKTGGHVNSNMYFMWPYLTDEEVWDPANLPDSRFVILWKALTKRDYKVSSVADVYNFLDGVNAFSQNTGETKVTGVHPDMHNLIPIIHDVENQEWQILNANDGGVYVSNVSKDPGSKEGDWIFAGNGLNTTQFYSVDKMPGGERYIGGSQDNGTWLGKSGENSTHTSKYSRALGGDGFGTVWHSQDPNLILGSLYNLDIRRSTDGGKTWSVSAQSISDEVPFITKIENSHSQPDIVFTLGESGVWRSEDFGLSWSLTPITENWSISSSFNNLEISDATPDVVWAGNGMSENAVLHVSTDNGKTFKETSRFDEVELGVVSGIASHPLDHKTAYALFSYAGAPKILRTVDMGQTWEDISGFAPSSSSTGFPDVSVMDLVVMPHDPSTLWAGTEIGIFESNDDGNTWHILEGNLPRVSVWDMNINEDQLVIGTHGRGIWTYTLPEAPQITLVPEILNVNVGISNEIGVELKLESKYDSIVFFGGASELGTITDTAIGENLFTFPINSTGNLTVYAQAYKDGSPFTTNSYELDAFEYAAASEVYATGFQDSEGDFVGSLSISDISGFDDEAVHSTHNYEDDKDYLYFLRVPVIIAEGVSKLFYKDVAIIEPGEDDAQFGTAEFKDYVAVEGSLDGINWITLGEGYDASYNSRWNSIYKSGLSGDKDDFVSHEIDLLEYFEPGDVVVFRFRLHSDKSKNAWGWAIDDLNIQGSILGANDELPGRLVVHPNPATDFIHLKGNRSIADLAIYSLSGVKVTVKHTEDFKRIDLRYVSSGVYIINLKYEDRTKSSVRIIKD